MNATFHPNSLAYHRRRQQEQLPKWKAVADKRAKGIPAKVIAAELGVCPSRVHYLENKWHSYRIANLKS